jgi:hypothetical protein
MSMSVLKRLSRQFAVCMITLGVVGLLCQPASAGSKDTMKKDLDTALETEADKEAKQDAVNDVSNLSPNQLAQEVSTDLRNSQNNMFNGKNDEAVELLLVAAKKMRRLEKVNPQHSKLMVLQGRLETQHRGLEKRTQKTIDLEGGTATAKATQPVFSTPSPTQPKKSSNALAQEVSTELRLSQSASANGNRDEAVQRFLAADKKLKELKAADPKHGKLMVLEGKADRLHANLESRTQNTIDRNSGAVTSKLTPGASTLTDTRHDTNSPLKIKQKVPHQARRDLLSAQNRMTSAEKRLDGLAENKSLDEKRREIKRIQDGIDAMRNDVLPRSKQLAAEKGVTSHPDFDNLDQRLAAIQPRIDQAVKELAAGTAQASASKADVDKDCAEVKAVLATVQTKLQKFPGNVIYYNDLKPVKKLIALLENFETNDQARVQDVVTRFGNKYGHTYDEVSKTVGPPRAYDFQRLSEGLDNVHKTRAAMAQDLAKRADQMIDDLPSKHDFYRLELQKLVTAWAKMATRFSSSDPQVKRTLASLDTRLAADTQAFNKKVDAAKWPGTDKSKDAKAALKYFQQSRDWAGRAIDARQPIAVSVIGKWNVQKRNIHKEPTIYGLPVYICVELDKEKGNKLARVYSVTMRTQEMAGAKSKPPFYSISVGDSYYIRRKKVK